MGEGGCQNGTEPFKCYLSCEVIVNERLNVSSGVCLWRLGREAGLPEPRQCLESSLDNTVRPVLKRTAVHLKNSPKQNLKESEMTSWGRPVNKEDHQTFNCLWPSTLSCQFGLDRSCSVYGFLNAPSLCWHVLLKAGWKINWHVIIFFLMLSYLAVI